MCPSMSEVNRADGESLLAANGVDEEATNSGGGHRQRRPLDQEAFATCHVPPNAVIPSPLVWPGAVSLMNS
jgi:hypothetical protein